MSPTEQTQLLLAEPDAESQAILLPSTNPVAPSGAAGVAVKTDEKLIAEAREAWGVTQLADMLIETGDLSAAKNIAPLNLMIDETNTEWTDEGSRRSGDVVDLAALVVRASRLEVAQMLVDVASGYPAPVRVLNSLQGLADEVKDHILPLQEEWDAFPHCLPPVLQKMADGIADVEGVPFELAASAVIGATSGCLGSGIVLESSGNKVVAGNLYILVSGESGVGKSITGSHAFSPIQAVEKELVKQHVKNRPAVAAKLALVERQIKAKQTEACKDATSSEAVLHELIKLETEKQALTTQEEAPCLISGEATPESLAKLMEANGGCSLSASSDARGIVKVLTGYYKNGEINDSLYVSAFTVEEQFRQNRIGRGTTLIDRPCLSIVWLVQGDMFRKMWSTPSFTEGGLLPRFLCGRVGGDPPFQTEQRRTLPAGVAEAYGRTLRELITSYRMHNGTPFTVKTSDGVRKIFIDYYNRYIERRREKDLKGAEASFAARWAENAWCMALVFHAAEHGVRAHLRQLDAETARCAVAIVSWFAIEQAKLLKEQKRDEGDVRTIKLMKLMRECGGKMTAAMVAKSGLVKPTKEAEKFLDSLAKENLLVRLTPQKTGRPTVHYSPPYLVKAT